MIHVLQPRWQDYIQSVHILSWLLLGAMSHNYIDGIAAEMKMAGNVGGQCLLLESLNHKLDEVTKGILILANGVIQKITTTQDVSPLYSYCFIVAPLIRGVFVSVCLCSKRFDVDICRPLYI